jgi:hypothetical protein
MKNRDPFIYCREVIPRKNGIPFFIAGYYTHAVLPFAFHIVCAEPLNYAAAHNLAPASFLGYLVQISTRGLAVINDVSRNLYILTTLI